LSFPKYYVHSFDSVNRLSFSAATDILKLLFITKPGVYVSDSQLIDNKFFQRLFIGDCYECIWFRRLLNESISNGYPLIIPIIRKTRMSGKNKSGFSFNDVLVDMMDLKRMSKPMLFSSLSDTQNRYIVKYHSNSSLSDEDYLNKFHSITRGRFKKFIEKLDEIFDNNIVYWSVPPYRMFSKILELEVRRVIPDLHEDARDVAKEILNAIDRYEYRITRSILYREVLHYDEKIRRCPDEVREAFRKAIIDPTYNLNIVLSNQLNPLIHKSSYKENAIKTIFKKADVINKSNIYLETNIEYEETELPTQLPLNRLDFNDIYEIRRDFNDLILNIYRKELQAELFKEYIKVLSDDIVHRLRYKGYHEERRRKVLMKYGTIVASIGALNEYILNIIFQPHLLDPFSIFLGLATASIADT